MTNAMQQLHDQVDINFLARLHLELSEMRSGLRGSSKAEQADAGTPLAPVNAPGVVRPGGDIGSGEGQIA